MKHGCKSSEPGNNSFAQTFSRQLYIQQVQKYTTDDKEFTPDS